MTYTPAKIEIVTPVSFADFWRTDPSSQIQDLFSGELGNILTIYCKSPSDYTPVSEGNGLKMVDGLVSTKAVAETKRLGFRLKVRDRRTDLRIAIEELMNGAVIASCNEAYAITIYDYCYLRREDRALGYRLRVGFFTDSLTGLQGNIARGRRIGCSTPLTIESGTERFEAGFEMKFMEIKKHSYY